MQQISDDRIIQAIRDRGLDPTPDLIERTRQQVQARMATSQTPKAVQSADPTRGVAAYDAFLRSQGAALGRQPKPEEGGGFIDIVQAGGAEGMARMFRTIDFATGMDKEPGGFVEGAQKYFEGVAAAPENQPRAGEEDTFTTNLARAIGNMAAFSIPAIAGGAAGTLIGGPAGTVAGISAATLGAGAAASATGGAVEYVNAYDEVMKSTGDEELATSAGLWAGLGGLTEGLDAALPVLGKIGKVLTRADKATGGAITDGIMKFGAKRMSSAVIGGAAMNFAQETGQEVWSDAVINHFKGNPSDAKEILQSFKQYAWSMGLPSALIGGAFGGLQGKLEQIQGEEEFKKFAAARAEGRVEREGLKPVGVVEREPGTEGSEFVPSDPLFKKTQEELKAAGDAGILREVEAPKELSYLADISEKKGSRVRFVETAEGSAFRGVYDPETGDILLNVNRPDDAINFTFGHELGGHALKRLSGDSFVTFRNKVQQLDPAGLAAAEKMARERQPGIAENADLVAEEGQSYYIEEVLGPWMRSIAKNPDGAAILESIAVDDRSMFRKIGEVVLDLFNDMGASFNTRRQTLKNLLGTPDLIGSEVAAGRGLSQQKAAQLALSLHGLMEGMDAGVYQRDAHQRRVDEFRARRAKAAQETEVAVKAAQEKRARRAEVENIRAAGLREEEQRRVGEETAREAATLKDREARAAEQLRYEDTLRGYAADDERRAKRAEREQAAEKKLRELQQATEDARYQSALERYSKERELTEAQRAQFEADFVQVEGMGTAAQQRAALNEMSSPTQRKVAQESGKGTRLESKKDVAARQAEAARLEPIVQENERSEQERRLSEERTRARAAALEQEARLATTEELGARMEAGMAEQEQTAAEREAALAEQAAEQRSGIEAQSVAEARARERAARELNRERKVTGRTQDAWRRYEDASNAYRTGGPAEEGVGATGAVRARRVHEIAALERQNLRGDRTSHPLSYATVPELRRMLAANLADEKRAAQQAFGDERMAAAYNELQRKARDPNNPEARSARRQLERMWSNLNEDQKLTLTGAGSRRGVFRPFSTEEITDALNARELGQQGKLTDVGMGPRFSMGDVRSRYEAALREVEAFKDGGNLVSDEAWGAIHHKLASERSPNDWMKAVEFSRENGILPYVSAGKYDIPVQINRDIRFSIASPKKGDAVHEGTGLALNKNGTVTLYYPTTNADARRVIRDRTLVAQNPNSSVLYLTNESNGMKVNAERGVIDQPTDGANVLVNIDPNLLSVAREYPDGRKDYFVPISEGKAFDGKLRQIRLFTLNVERNKAISADITLKKMSDSITKAVSEYEKMDAKAKRARLSEAKRVLREQHNVGNLLTVNKKLEKTEVNESLIQKVGRMVLTAGLGLSSAQRLNKSKLSTCPNAAICKDLCLGETSGLNELYGGVGAQRSGPRLSQYLKTEAMVLHPEEFAVALYSEIAKLQANAQSQNRIPSIRLNVTSDFHPFVWESMILAFPETIFYDYTKLDSDAIAPNHHITYSSTGLSQVVDDAPVLNQYQNWMKMTRRMNQGFNTAMAFSTREYLPESLIDDVTGVEYKVIDGDDYDARFADKQPDGQPGVIVGLRNKDNTQKPGGPSSVKTNGFFVHYDPAVHGRSLIVLNQDTLQPSQRETNAPQVRPQQQGGVVERPQAPQGGLSAETSGGNRLVEGQAPEARFSLGARNITQRDRAYLSAVAAGDMETAQSMVDEAAKAAGFSTDEVFYHGTEADWNVYEDVGPSTTGGKWVRRDLKFMTAIFLSNNKDIAESYGSNVRGFYVNFGSEKYDSDPGIVEADGKNWAKVYGDVIDLLKYGAPAVIVRNVKDSAISSGPFGDTTTSTVVVLTNNDDLKSADPVTRDNAGNVIPLSQRFGESPDVRYSMGGFASFSDALDDVRKRGDIATQSFRTTFVDYLNETKKLLEAAAKTPYQKIEAMQRTLGRRGISSARIKDEVTPRFNKLVDAMRSAGVSHGDVADFMRARVQPIAEKVVKERRSKMDPTGTMYEAQITATEAADIMKRLKAQPNYGDIVRIVKMVDDVNQRALDINLASGKIDRDSYDKMMAQYDPAVQGMANPEGFKTFYGSLESMPERSVVDSALLDVPGIGRGVGRTGRPYRGRTGVLKGSDVELKSPVVNAFVGLQNAVIRGVKSEEQRSYAKLVKDLNDPTFAVIHETLPTEDVVGSDGYVHRVPKGDWAEQEGWLPYIENGKWKAIEFKGDNRLIAEDLKAKTVSAPIRGVSEVTRKVASLMTRLDPTFMLRNIPRDWGWAFLAGTSKYGTAFTKAMASEYKPALKDLWAVKRGGAPSGLLKQYLDAGAEISSMGFKNYEDNLADLEKALSAKDPNLATKIQNTWESWVGETNDVLENATRYAAFRAAVREGKSVGEAMLVAKEGVALNFEQTGRVGRPINSAFAFFNAGVNGTDAIIRLLTKEGDAGTRARRMAASVVGMGIAAELLNRMVSEDGDDEVPVYDNISEFEKNRNFLFMRPDGSYFKVPIPFGFNAVYAFGRNMAAYMSGARSAMAAATDSVSFAMESASPFGSGPMLQVISPTLLDPIVQWKTNETFTGSKIAPDLEQFGRQTKAPHEIFWKNTADMPKEIAELVAEVTEVGDSGRGFIDFRPDMLEHWASSYMGGVGRAAIDLSNTIGAAYKGEAPDAREAFAVRHFIGEASPYAIDKRYRDMRSEIEQVQARYKQLIEEGDRPTALRWRAANAQLFRASGTLKSIERALDKIPNTPENEERRRTIKARLVRQTGYTQE